jgi:hypothetical protein
VVRCSATEEIYKSAVDDDAEDFPKLLTHIPPVVIGVKFVSTFVDWGDQSLVPNIGEDARTEDDCHGRCWRKTKVQSGERSYLYL